MQRDKVSRKARRGLVPREAHHPAVPSSRWCLLQQSLVFSAGPWLGLGSQVENSQLGQSIGGGPLLAAGSRLCPSITPTLLLIRLCQGRVCSAITGVWAVQVGGRVRRRGGSAGCGPVWRGHWQAQLLWMVVQPCSGRKAGQGHKQGFPGLSDLIWPGETAAQAGARTCPKSLSQSSKEPGPLTPSSSTSGIMSGLQSQVNQFKSSSSTCHLLATE